MAGISGPKSSVAALLYQCYIERVHAVQAYQEVHAELMPKIHQHRNAIGHFEAFCEFLSLADRMQQLPSLLDRCEAEILGHNTNIRNLHLIIEHAQRREKEAINRCLQARINLLASLILAVISPH